MKHLALFLSLLSSFAFASDDNRAICLKDLLVRQMVLETNEKLSLAISGADPLAYELVLAHVQTFQRANPKMNYANWRRFDLSWLFMPEFSEQLEAVVKRFENGANDMEGNPLPLLKWLEKLEHLYTNSDIDMAVSWTRPPHSNRKKFVSRILLLTALRVQRQSEELRQDVPVQWNTQQAKAQFADTMRAEITYAFRDLQKFQTAYDIYFRQQVGSRLVRQSQESPGQQQMARQIRELGGALPGRQPWIQNFEKVRSREDALQVWSEATAWSGEKHFPLTVLFVQDEGVTDVKRLYGTLDLWDSAAHFIASVNEQRQRTGLPVIELGVGVEGSSGSASLLWHRELLVQTCLYQIRQNGRRVPYVEFEVIEADENDSFGSPENPYAIGRMNPFFFNARLNARALNAIIYQRLIEEPVAE